MAWKIIIPCAFTTDRNNLILRFLLIHNFLCKVSFSPHKWISLYLVKKQTINLKSLGIKSQGVQLTEILYNIFSQFTVHSKRWNISKHSVWVSKANIFGMKISFLFYSVFLWNEMLNKYFSGKCVTKNQSLSGISCNFHQKSIQL